ncbi:SRPBCC family protein [Streptomyces sp. NPDC090445]|uniref:SRPBCC family protein n=1 Tax=Streptomyces sp. NPDC090445 TaxID=3365963 RepID=UPI003819A09E
MGEPRVVVQREMAAPVERVWRALTDLESMPGVVSGVDAVEVLTPGPFRVGTRWRETRRMFGRQATEEMYVTVCDAPERYVAEADHAGMHYVSEFRLDARAPGRTAVTMTFSAAPVAPAARGKRPGLFMRLLNRLGTKAVAKAVMKDLSDVAASVERDEPDEREAGPGAAGPPPPAG